MATSVDPLKKLFKNTGITGPAGLGLDGNASDIIIANINNTTAPMCTGGAMTTDEMETDDTRLLIFGADGSGSMEDIAPEFIACFNDVVIPGLLEGAKSQVGALRYSGLIFNNTVRPLWGGGWLPLGDNPPKLTANDYRPNGGTALYKGVLDLVTAATAYALQIADVTGTFPEVTIALLTDGANNQPPIDPKPVLDVTSKLSPELFTLSFLYFETYERVDARQICTDIGFRDFQESKKQPGETPEQQRKRFRHMMKVYSQSITGRVSRSKVGSSSGTTGAGGSTGFWVDPNTVTP